MRSFGCLRNNRRHASLTFVRFPQRHPVSAPSAPARAGRWSETFPIWASQQDLWVGSLPSQSLSWNSLALGSVDTSTSHTFSAFDQHHIVDSIGLVECKFQPQWGSFSNCQLTLIGAVPAIFADQTRFLPTPGPVLFLFSPSFMGSVASNFLNRARPQYGGAVTLSHSYISLTSQQ